MVAETAALALLFETSTMSKGEDGEITEVLTGSKS